MDIEVQQRVTVFDKQLHGRHENLIDGQVVAISGSVATVQVDNEEFPRDFKLSQLRVSSDVYGAERTSPFDNVVYDGMRRK